MATKVQTLSQTRKRLLDPIERSSEVLFGLVMVLTFTGSFRAAGADHDSVTRMLVAALGCNLAWGIIDAVFYLISTLSQRGHNLKLLRDVQVARPEPGRQLLNDEISDDLAAVLTDNEIETVRMRMLQLPAPRKHAHLNRHDYLAALGVFLLVFLSTFPVVLPFLFMTHPARSLRLSNFIGIVMLFFVGIAYGRYANHTPWKVGVLMVLLGLAMVGLTIVLGG
ncbi:MAG TPA: VIT1/CCC1 transporter family protein [Terriglobales bacterium]|nr:VIT1/CCC1 transporter family protein [Terriglobales bacterium]